MSQHGVRALDLAWLMGYRWGHWLMSPTWDPRTGWFEDWPEPIEASKQSRILKLCRDAHQNPEFWKRRYVELRLTCMVVQRGLEHKALAAERLFDEVSDWRYRTLHKIFQEILAKLQWYRLTWRAWRRRAFRKNAQ